MERNRKPDWLKWELCPEVALWQAVALWLDIDPDQIKHHPQSWMGNDYLFDESAEFDRRLDIAKANFGVRKALRPTAIPLTKTLGSAVALGNFAAWALKLRDKGLSTPPEFAQLASAEPATPDNIAPDYPTVKSKLLWTFHEAACYLGGRSLGPTSQVTSKESTALIKRIYDDIKDGADTDAFEWHESRASNGWIGGRRAKPSDLVRFASQRTGILGYELPTELSELIASKAESDEVTTEANEPPTASWVLQVQTEAAAMWKRLRKAGANPTKHSIRDDLPRWCRENDVTTGSKINPSGATIYKWALRKWEPPKN